MGTQTVSQMKKDVDVKFTSQIAELEKVQERISSNTTQLTHLEPRVKKNEDQIRHIDDTLDGLNKSINDLDTKHNEAADRTAELNVLINNTQIQLKDQEKKLVDQSNSDLNLIKGQINDLENLAGASNQRIAELDNGTQSMLEKLVGLENGMTDKIKNLKAANEKGADGLRQELNVRLSELKEEYVATTNSIKMESQSLSQSLQESKTLQVSIEKRVNDIDSGNQQLLEKILAVEQDLDGKVQGINNASGGISDKISSLENDSKSHAQNIVTIQESLAIQNDTMKKVESERQNAAAKAKEDIDATSAANTKAINEMRDHFSTALSSLEITLKKGQTDGNSNLSDKLQQVENDLGSRMLVLEKSGPESLKTFGSQLEEKLQEMNKDLELKLKETDGKTNKNGNDIASQSNMLREHNESINSNITSISSISNKIAAFDKDLDGLTKQVGSNATEIGLLKENHGSQVARVSDLEGKVKLNQDHIKNIDDTLDGLKHSIDVFEGRHIETVEKMKEVTVLAGAIQTQVKEQGEKIVEQSNSNLNLVKDQIKDLENQQGVSAQKITELDSGIQSMLEKVLGVEKNLGDGLSRLDSADKNILENLSSLNSETTQTVAQMKKDIDVKLNSQQTELEKVQEIISSNSTQLTKLEPRVKQNEDQIRHIDDTLDGLKKSICDLDAKHIEAADRTAELNVLINNTQVQLKDQEKKLVDQSNSDLNLIKGQIN